MGSAGAHTCAECGSPLAGDQRYCLVCGARAGSRSPELERLIHNVVAQPGGDGAPAHTPATAAQDGPATSTATVAAGGAVAGASGADGLRLPPPKISAVLVLVFLAFGVLLGNVAGSRVDSTLAAGAGSRVRLVLPPARPATSTTASTSSSAESSPPASEPEATPSPAASSPASSTKTTAAASSGESGSGESGSSGEGSQAAKGTAATRLPPIKHVFLITLSNEPYATVFGPASTAHYLSQTLEKRGLLLVRYDAVAHEELADGVALLSGQGPTVETAANCPTYADIAPAALAASGQVTGAGCVYPASTPTLPGQLSSHHLTWRAYVEGIDEAGMQAGACAHPASGASDPTAAQSASTGPYATFRNPFVYFHSITDSAACAADDVGISRLQADLASAKSTPSFSYIVPDRCHDGNPTPCTPGAPAGMGPADGFIQRVVPEILASKAYHEGGLLVLTVDEAPSSGEYGDSSSCCGQPRFPNLPASSSGLSPRGGGAVGALLISRYLKAGTTSQEPFNHFSLLRSIEDLFKLPHLGYAGLAGVKPFEPSMFTATPSG
jgi:hypothetical protein